MSHHRITWTIDRDTVTGNVSCSAPPGADAEILVDALHEAGALPIGGEPT